MICFKYVWLDLLACYEIKEKANYKFDLKLTICVCSFFYLWYSCIQQSRVSSASVKLHELIPKEKRGLRWFLTPQEASNLATGTHSHTRPTYTHAHAFMHTSAHTLIKQHNGVQAESGVIHTCPTLLVTLLSWVGIHINQHREFRLFYVTYSSL